MEVIIVQLWQNYQMKKSYLSSKCYFQNYYCNKIIVHFTFSMSLLFRGRTHILFQTSFSRSCKSDKLVILKSDIWTSFRNTDKCNFTVTFNKWIFNLHNFTSISMSEYKLLSPSSSKTDASTTVDCKKQLLCFYKFSIFY